jgi:hypothetical protein
MKYNIFIGTKKTYLTIKNVIYENSEMLKNLTKKL